VTAPYVSFVESNIKGGVRAALSMKTLIVGPNGTGKSAVANTIELALTGKVSDLVGRREVAAEALLQSLAPNRKGELLARAAFSDGREAVWRAGGKSKKAKHVYPEAILDPASALPLRPVYDAIMGDVNTARKFFLQYAVGAVTDADVMKRIPESLHPYYRRATLAGTLSTSTAVDRLLAALDHAKKMARSASDQAKAAETAASQTTQGLSPLPTEAEEKALRDAEKAAEKHLDGLKQALTKRDAVAAALTERDSLWAQVQAAEQAYLAAKGEAARLAAALAQMPVPPGADPMVVSLRQTIEAHLQARKSECLCCGAPLNVALDMQTVVTPAEVWSGRLQMLDQYLAQQQQAVHAYTNAKAEVNAAQIREQQALAAGKDVYGRYEATSNLLAGAGTIDPPTPEALAQAEAALSVAREALRAVDVLKASWATASKARDGVNEAQKDAAEWKNLQNACSEAIVSLLDGGVTNFAARVQSYLPSYDKFHIALREGDKAVFQFGLTKSNVLFTALSGAEWARVTAAMANACRASQEKVAVVIPEERAFDAVTLAFVLEAFTSMDTQVVFTTPVAPHTLPAGWTVIDTASEQHRTGTPPTFDQPAIPQEVAAP
jgi:hypothetical protein